MNHLKPCPFCGGSAELRTTGGWSGIGCNTNKCPAYLHALMFRTPAEAGAVWNRRATYGVLASDDAQPPCPVCGGTERNRAGYLLCECPAASLKPAAGVAVVRGGEHG